jgi:hypothetical protein
VRAGEKDQGVGMGDGELGCTERRRTSAHVGSTMTRDPLWTHLVLDALGLDDESDVLTREDVRDERWREWRRKRGEERKPGSLDERRVVRIVEMPGTITLKPSVTREARP